MAGKPQYSEADRNRVFVALAVTEGSVKGAARETGIPETTVRRWKKEFEQSGPPEPQAIDEAVGDFLDKAEGIQWKALLALESKIDQASPRDLITVIGILNDKITRARGVADKTVEHVHRLPPADEIRDRLVELASGAVAASRLREHELVEVALREQPERLGLPAPRP